MTQQNIYYVLTKQRTDQSMHSQGALASYERLDQFLRKHSHDLIYKKASLEYFVWVNNKEAAEEASNLERRLFSDFGEPQQKKSPGFSILKTKWHYNEIFDWQLDGDIEQHLEYVDRLGKLPHLQPRPPLNVVIVADFWLTGTEKIEAVKSNVIAWFSPASNKACFTLNFPHIVINDKFARYREIIQTDCPIKLEDKYFYLRKAKGSGGYSFKKAF